MDNIRKGGTITIKGKVTAMRHRTVVITLDNGTCDAYCLDPKHIDTYTPPGLDVGDFVTCAGCAINVYKILHIEGQWATIKLKSALDDPEARTYTWRIESLIYHNEEE